MTIRWQSHCCGAPLESYKDTECPACGEPCRAEPPDLDPPDDYTPPIHKGRKDREDRV